MLRYILLPFLSLLLWSCSCQPSGIDATLAEAERLMDARPDSALALVESVDPSAIHSRSTRALHALLLTQAQFKNYIDVPNDSLISIAVDYFDSTDDIFHQLLAHFYYGNVKYSMKMYPQALVHLLKAYDSAKELNDKFWMAMTARELSHTYNATYNGNESLRFAEIAFRNFKDINRQPHTNYAILDLAASYISVGEYEKAEESACQGLDSALKFKDYNLEIEAKRMLGMTYLNMRESASAKPYFEEICNNGPDIAQLSDSLYLLLTYIREKDMQKAKALKLKCSDMSKGLGNWMQYEIYEALDSLPQAMATLKRMDSESDSILRYMLTRNVSGTLIDYYNYQKDLQEAKLRTSRVIVWCIGLIGLLLGLLGISIFQRYRKRQKDIINRNVEIAENLREMISIRDRESQKKIHSLLADRFEVFDEMMKVMYEDGDSERSKKRISEMINMLVKDFSRNKKKISELESYADRYYDNIMTSFRTDFPKLVEADYLFFLYSIFGFSNASMALFLHEDDPDAIYGRRKRMKNRLRNSESANKEKYLSVLR